MVILEFLVHDQNLILKTDTRRMRVTSDTINYFKCKFTFNDVWSGFEKRIYFKNASFNITKSVLPDALGYCFIPWEVLAHTGLIYCNVVGIKYDDSDTPERITAGPIPMFLHNPGPMKEHCHPVDPLNVFVQQEEAAIEPDQEQKPTPTEFEQFVYQIENLIDGLSNNYEDLDNKPQIEGVTLIGDKSYPELNLTPLTNIEIEEMLT